MEHVTLDICVPYWGDPTTFFETIESVRAQSDPEWRLTVIDDDYPGTAVADTVKPDPQLRLFAR